MLSSLSPLKYMILKPHTLCVLLYSSNELMTFLVFPDINLVTDQNFILHIFDRQNTIPFTYKMFIYMFKSLCLFSIGRGKGVLVILDFFWFFPNLYFLLIKARAFYRSDLLDLFNLLLCHSFSLNYSTHMRQNWMWTVTLEALGSSLPYLQPQSLVLSTIPCYLSHFSTSSNH